MQFGVLADVFIIFMCVCVCVCVCVCNIKYVIIMYYVINY